MAMRLLVSQVGRVLKCPLVVVMVPKRMFSETNGKFVKETIHREGRSQRVMGMRAARIFV